MGAITRNAGKSLRWLSLQPCLGLAVSACQMFTAYANFTPTLPYKQQTHTPDQVLLVFNGNEPTADFVRVGQIDAGRSDYQNDDDIFNAIRATAVKYGLDGVVDIGCGPGNSAAFQCVGTGFVFKSGQ
jgi:hypothetical protein